jgi:hypothetical protein
MDGNKGGFHLQMSFECVPLLPFITLIRPVVAASFGLIWSLSFIYPQEVQ